MNENHARLCSSPEWAEYLRDEVLPVVLRDVELGDEMLEIGPGPGAATECLRHQVKRLTAAELDEEAAGRLAERFAGSNVEVVVEDATALRFADESFDSVGCFTMLHHVPSAEAQDRILAEAYRLLRPGGVFVGSDSLDGEGFREFHAGDTCNPVRPPHVLEQLQSLGFTDITVRVNYELRFAARKPDGSGGEGECGHDESCEEGATR
jgi:SAM-dependent methyltransferase